MWLALAKGNQHRFRLENRQTIWPAPDGSDAEFLVFTESEVTQEVVLTTPRVVRLKYQVASITAGMAVGQTPPTVWPDAAAVKGGMFEIMITERGAIIVPATGPKLANRHATWLALVAEDVRSVWPVPPDDAVTGSEWRLVPIMPGGLPPGTTSAAMDVKYRVNALAAPNAEVGVHFEVRLMLEARKQAIVGEGNGDMVVQVHRNTGPLSAKRHARLALARRTRNVQVLRTDMVLTRL